MKSLIAILSLFAFSLFAQSPGSLGFDFYGGSGVATVGSITAGSLYTSPPAVTFTGGGGGASPVATSTLGLVSATAAVNGSGYVPADTITLAGGTSTTTAVATVATTNLASVAVNAAGTTYIPAQTITLSGGTSSVAAILTVATTKVVSATVAAAGSGGTNGAGVIVTGTTGTGTKFTASVTVTSGAIASVQSIVTNGSYTANPTTLTAEPVTGAGLTGAQLSVVMGVSSVAITTPGSYTVNAASFTQASTSGSGTGATFNTASYGANTLTVATAGAYSVIPLNAVAQASTSGAGTGATLTAVWGVSSVIVSTPGGGYASAPTVVFTGTPGSGASATAVLDSQATTANATRFDSILPLTDSVISNITFPASVFGGDPSLPGAHPVLKYTGDLGIIGKTLKQGTLYHIWGTSVTFSSGTGNLSRTNAINQ